MVTAPTRRPGGFNDADLHYIRRALLALRDARKASDQAAAWSSDPQVRTLARRAGAMQQDDIGELTSMLDGSGRRVDDPDRDGVLATSVPAVADDDVSSLDRLELDRRLVESLTAHAEAAIASARAEMIEGFEPSIRRLAEHSIRANNRELSALRPGISTRSWPAPPVIRGGCVQHLA
jgi:uncharacterized protein (DUF305 family)